MFMMKRLMLVIYFRIAICTSNGCLPRDYGNGGTVCVCTADHCDTIEPVTPLKTGQYLLYTSNKDGLRFNKTIGDFNQHFIRSDVTIKIDHDTKYQTILGWGGAFTDSAGININALKGIVRQHLLSSYFSNEGLEYSLCRVPIGGTDFSTYAYTYDDVTDDKELVHFNLTREDYKYKIPLIKEAFTLTNGKLKLFGSAWSPPIWMKTNNAISGIGFLKPEYYQTWANYHVKFLEGYENEGIKFWGLTTGNEPTTAYVPFVKLNSLAWTPFSQRQWIAENLGPTIRKSKYKDIKIMVLDDQRFCLPWWLVAVFANADAKKYIDGIALHWYWDSFFPASVLDCTHEQFPEKFMLNTEACIGDKPFQKKVDLGSWARGEMYAYDIIEDLNHWVSGWLDWNMALDETGGPTYINNNVDSPIIVNKTAQEFYKQPMFYALGHFSKFIPPGSIRIKSSVSTGDLKITAFLRPDNGISLIVFNDKNRDMNITISDISKGTFIITAMKHSITTVLYW
ncbi:Glucocerebrosidase 1a [Carabus blaptoides fortunei]